MEWLLVVFGWAFMLVMLWQIGVPYLRGRADLLTSWNLFLLGSANYVGLAAVHAGSLSAHVNGFRNSDYIRFVAGAAVFYAVAFLTYRFVEWPDRAAGRRMRKWPPNTPGALAALLPVFLVISLGYVFVPGIQFVGQVVSSVGLVCVLFLVVLAFVAWLRSMANPFTAAVFVVALLTALLLSLYRGGGRRTLLSVVLALPICYYWTTLRYLPAWRTLIPLGLAALLGFAVIAGYSTFRHSETEESGLARAFERLRRLPTAALGLSSAERRPILGGDSVEVSLIAIRRYTREAEPHPFYTVFYILTNPIPRALWEDKPEGLGVTLPRDSGRWETGKVSWGPGIVGHGFHEGGLHMLVLYGFLYACLFRFIDGLLVRQNDNAYLLAIVSAVSAQVIGLSRGDLALFTLNILAAFVIGYALCTVARFLIGTVVYPTDAERAYAVDTAPNHSDGAATAPEFSSHGI